MVWESNILNFNFINYIDSHMVVPSKSLPEILQDEGEYTRIYDNIWI
jgi:hypothetical protein